MTDEQKLAWFEAQAERACDEIGLARRLGQDAQATRLEARLDHIKSPFRSQFG